MHVAHAGCNAERLQRLMRAAHMLNLFEPVAMEGKAGWRHNRFSAVLLSAHPNCMTSLVR